MKIFKLFVCVALILSISLINSFAAISVSDGSAFVTKAEFAADLNNLSNRMSTLENSLDAKIDSLVSSYLSRNGIWNGEKQIVKKNTTQYGNTFSYFKAIIGLGADYNTTLDAGVIWYANLGGRSTIYSSKIYPFKDYGSNATYTIVDNFNKSGLICVNYRNEYMTGNPYDTSTKKYRNTSTAGSGGMYSNREEWSYGFSVPFTWTFYEWTQDNTQIGNALSIYSEVYNTMNASVPNNAKIKFTDNYGSWYAFVSKNNKLVLKTSNISSNPAIYGKNCIYGINKNIDDANTGFSKVGLSCMYSIYDVIIY